MLDDLKEIRFEFLLGLAGIVLLVSFFLPWFNLTVLDKSLHGYSRFAGNWTFAGSWIMIIGALISFDIFRSKTMRSLRPLSDAPLGIVGAMMSLIGNYRFNADIGIKHTMSWGIYVSIAAAVVGIVASLLIVWQVRAEMQPEREKKPKRKSGGL